MATPPITLAQIGQPSDAANATDPVQATQAAVSLAPKAAPADHFKLARMIMLGAGAGADAFSTLQALHSNPQSYEANPLLGGVAPHTAAILAVKGATAAGEGWALNKLAQQHPTLATVLAGAIAGTSGLVALHNLSLVKK
jgi:hypothetical protein